MSEGADKLMRTAIEQIASKVKWREMRILQKNEKNDRGAKFGTPRALAAAFLLMACEVGVESQSFDPVTDENEGASTDLGDASGDDSIIDETSLASGSQLTSSVATDEDETALPTVCTDEEMALYQACQSRESMEFYVREGTTNPCRTGDYCGWWDCNDAWAKKSGGIRDVCDAKYTLCGELSREYRDVSASALSQCQGACARRYSQCNYDHYCAVGGPENADPAVTMKCNSDYTTCLEGCAPLPPIPLRQAAPQFPW